MDKILTATSRGQITLPKSWRDKMNTTSFIATIEEKRIIIQPLCKEKKISELVEDSWDEYKSGKVVTHDEIIKKYGL